MKNPTPQSQQEIEFAGLMRQFYRRAGPERAGQLLEEVALCASRRQMLEAARRAVSSLPTLH
jgi:hypothetical protein